MLLCRLLASHWIIGRTAKCGSIWRLAALVSHPCVVDRYLIIHFRLRPSATVVAKNTSLRLHETMKTYSVEMQADGKVVFTQTIANRVQTETIRNISDLISGICCLFLHRQL